MAPVYTEPRKQARFDQSIAAARIIGMLPVLLKHGLIQGPPSVMCDLGEFLNDYYEASDRLLEPRREAA